MGHCVAVSGDTQAYVHIRPEQFAGPPVADARGGPGVAFHAVFSRPGLSRVWGQFRCRGEVVVADFVVRVEPSSAPRWVVDLMENF
jgi:hypothetical protein